jgi:hypothetical protein
MRWARRAVRHPLMTLATATVLAGVIMSASGVPAPVSRAVCGSGLALLSLGDKIRDRAKRHDRP